MFNFSAGNDDDFGFIGTPQQVVEQMRPFVELSVDYFVLGNCSASGSETYMVTNVTI